MFPTGEIGFGCHVTLVLKVIDFSKIYHNSLCNSDKHVILVFFHHFDVKQLKLSIVSLVTFTVCVQNQGQGQGHAFLADFCGEKIQ